MALRQEILRWGEKQLQEAGIADWKTDAWLLYEEATAIDRARFFLQNREMMPQEEIDKYSDMIERRCQRIPLQYITGIQEFMGMKFVVDENVLIPRFDTEVLVLETEKHLDGRNRVLDMCTGSGCIAISLKKRNEWLQVTAVDYSEQALNIARQNSRLLNGDIDFYCSDLFEMFKQTEKNKQTENFQQTENFEQIEKFDIIVSNPPYIPSNVIESLEDEVKCHEPRMALDGTEDGLEFYRRITKDSKAFLADNGMLFYEIGHDQGEAVSAVMKAEGFCDIHVIKDLAGLDRVVYGGMKNV